MDKSLGRTYIVVVTAAFGIAGCATSEPYYSLEDGDAMSKSEKAIVCKDLEKKWVCASPIT